MNQKVIIKILRLTRGIIISYIRRQYVRLKLRFWGNKLKKEKQDAEKAIATAEESAAAAEYLANNFESEYQEYLRKRGMRPASGRLLSGSGSAERHDQEAGDSNPETNKGDRDSGQDN